MSDSEDSDYIVSEHVEPDTVRTTYDNEDPISEKEEDDSSSDSEEENESDQEIPNEQCKLNGNGVKTEAAPKEQPVRKKPVAEPVKSNSRFILYVTNLSGETTKSMLEDFFRDAGEIRAIRIPRVRLGCYAFVEMKELEGYKAGLKFNNKELDGRKIQVYEGSKNKKHTTATAKNLKRKNQQFHLTNMKMKKNNIASE